MKHWESHLYTYAVALTQGAAITPENLTGMKNRAKSNGHTEEECRAVEAEPQKFIQDGYSYLRRSMRQERPSIYYRPNKPMRVEVRKRNEVPPLGEIKAPEVVAVDKDTECHVTSSDVAARMVEYLGPKGDYLTLEPSAGTGQIARALIETGHSVCELTMIERHIELARQLQKIGPTINRCFLDYADELKGQAAFPRIIMNPPFRAVRKHIEAALSLLGRGGHQEPATLVVLVPVNFDYPDAEELEFLPVNTFVSARVHTKIIRFSK